MAKVNAHIEELEVMDAKRVTLQSYKSELLAKVDERAKEIEHAHEKEAQVHLFSQEMKKKVQEYEAHLAEKARMTEILKNAIIKEAQGFYGGAYCVDEEESS